MSTARVADVALDPRSVGSEATYTYRIDESVRPGDAVFVPLGTRSVLGFVTATYDATEEDLGFAFSKLRPTLGEVEGLGIPAPLVDLAGFVAREYLCSLPVALSPILPPGVRDRLVTAWSVIAAKAESVDLSPLQREVLKVIAELGGVLVEQKSKPLPASTLRALRLLRNKGVVRQTQRVIPFAEKRKGEAMICLCADSARIDKFLSNEGKRKPAQALTLMALQGAESPRFTAAEIKALAGVTEATLKALLDAGLLERVDPDAAPVSLPPQPNPHQSLAIEAIGSAIAERRHEAFLLFGVTGSGKTEVYLRAAAEALRQGRVVLYLVPEIALAAQAISQLRQRFGQSVAVLHSELAQSERIQNWLRIRQGHVGVVLGARSALFAPVENLGLIVLDEEHEGSYKQESAPRYHSKALAMFLGRRHNCPVVLGSATPSIDSFYEAERAELGGSGLTLLTLPQRAASAQLPSVVVEDLTEGYRVGKPSILTENLQVRMAETLANGRQTILFLNRRAYAPFLICRDCGHQMQCPNCAVSLSFHRKDQRLRCHHCGYNQRPPDECPNCRGARLNPFGVGTEKVEEFVAEAFPTARVARLDRDVARRKGVLEQTLASFRSGDIDILVGTQIVAKGLDFPNVTLVGVIAADITLNIPDFRSGERTFQLLSQVAGRAGRGIAHGTVVIQTFNPDNPAVRSSQVHDYLTFYEHLKIERLEAGYPPFRRLVNIVLSGESRTAVHDAAAEARNRLGTLSRAYEVLGPVDCALERVQNRWRRHMVVKLPSETDARPIWEALLGFEPKGVQIILDVDPYNLM